MRIKVLSFFMMIALQATVLFAKPGFGEAVKLNNYWRFTLQNIENASAKNFNDHRWQMVNLPHDWSVKQQLSPTLASCQGYLPGGIGWYRKTEIIPESRKNEKVYIYFEGVYNRSEVYINGELLGKRPNGYISFMYDATPHIKFGEENVIAVKVDHSQQADSRWYTGSGIYRDVYLVYANQTHIAQWGVFAYPTVANSKRGELAISVDVKNNSYSKEKVTVVNELMDASGKVISRKRQNLNIDANKDSKVSTKISISSPKLWSIENPNLYKLKTSIVKNGAVIDETVTTTGFRDFKFDPNKGFALNGKWMKMKGVCIHHDAGVLGAAVPREVWHRRLLNLKEIGVNAIRTSHNPQSSDLYELCDELGFFVMDEVYDEWEFPKRKWLSGWNVGTPGFEGTYDIFKEWGEIDMADVVKRDRNHISIFAWSIGNEVDYPNDPYSHPVLDGGENTGFTQPIFGGYKKDAPDAIRLGDIAKRLVKVTKEHDPYRPVTAGLAGVAMSNETEYPGALDIAGYNYTENMYDSDHKKYPNRVIYGSENRHELEPWKYVRDKEFIFGQFLWTGIDYLGESGRWPSRGFYSGLLDFGGFIKPRGYFRQSLWADEPMAYIGTYPTPIKGSRNQMQDVWSQLDADNESNYVERRPSIDAWPIWNYAEGQSIRVVAYTNAPKAKLLLNGKEVGKTQDYNDDSGVVYWDIPYEKGVLKVVGMDNSGKEIATNEIKSSNRPTEIKIISEEQVITKDGIAQVVIQVVDENGIPVMLSDDEVTCHISQNGELLGLESSNNSDMTDYTDNVHRVFHGRMVAYIKLKNDAEGDIKVRFTSPWLDYAETIIKTK